MKILIIKMFKIQKQKVPTLIYSKIDLIRKKFSNKQNKGQGLLEKNQNTNIMIAKSLIKTTNKADLG